MMSSTSNGIWMIGRQARGSYVYEGMYAPELRLFGPLGMGFLVISGGLGG
jgi:hypothetical protein